MLAFGLHSQIKHRQAQERTTAAHKRQGQTEGITVEMKMYKKGHLNWTYGTTTQASPLPHRTAQKHFILITRALQGRARDCPDTQPGELLRNWIAGALEDMAQCNPLFIAGSAGRGLLLLGQWAVIVMNRSGSGERCNQTAESQRREPVLHCAGGWGFTSWFLTSSQDMIFQTIVYFL